MLLDRSPHHRYSDHSSLLPFLVAAVRRHHSFSPFLVAAIPRRRRSSLPPFLVAAVPHATFIIGADPRRSSSSQLPLVRQTVAAKCCLCRAGGPRRAARGKGSVPARPKERRSECWPDLGGVHAAEPIGVFFKERTCRERRSTPPPRFLPPTHQTTKVATKGRQWWTQP